MSVQISCATLYSKWQPHASLDCIAPVVNAQIQYPTSQIRLSVCDYSTVTDFAKLRGWSTLHPRMTAI